jgi:hypothetical protein
MPGLPPSMHDLPGADDPLLTLTTLTELADMPEERARNLRELLDGIRDGEEGAGSDELAGRLEKLRRGETDPQVLSLARQAAIAAGRARIGLGPAKEAVPGRTDTLLRLRHTTELKRHYSRINSGRSLEQRYDLGEPADSLLAVGGFGAAYRATERGTGREVVIKFVHGEGKTPTFVAERFRREVRGLVAAEDAGAPRVTRLVEHGELNGRIYVVTEFVPGGTLHELLRDYPDGLPAVVAVHWGLQLAETLGRLHDAGIVHRDLKPANLLLASEPDSGALDRLDDDPAAPLDAVPDLVLADFGAVLLYREERFSRFGGPGASTPYTRGYAPMEQVFRLPEQGPHTDLFALGVLLTEMFTGSRRREQATRLLDGGGDEEPGTDALDALERIPPRLAEVLADCVESRPELRLTDIRKLEIALRAELATLRPDGEVAP